MNEEGPAKRLHYMTSTFGAHSLRVMSSLAHYGVVIILYTQVEFHHCEYHVAVVEVFVLVRVCV